MNGFAIAVAAGLLISTSYLVSQPEKSNSNPQSPQQKVATDKPPIKPPAKEKPDRDWFDYTTLGLTAVLAITAIVGTRYAVRTLRVLRHEARIAVSALKASSKLARAAKTSADTLTSAADAARQSSEFAKTTTKDSERADVLIESTSIKVGNYNWIQNGDAKLVVNFRNFGRTRATEVGVKVELTVTGANLVRGKYEPPTMVLGKGQDHTVVHPVKLDTWGHV
jgi:hypothetical protein